MSAQKRKEMILLRGTVHSSPAEHTGSLVFVQKLLNGVVDILCTVEKNTPLSVALLLLKQIQSKVVWLAHIKPWFVSHQDFN